MTLWTVFGIVGAAVFGLVTLLWIVSLLLKDAGIVDVFWGTGFVVANWLYFVLAPDGFLPRKWLISILITIWGLRLSLRILLRNWGKPEDFRYRRWREEAGEKWWWQSYYRVFLLQGFQRGIILVNGSNMVLLRKINGYCFSNTARAKNYDFGHAINATEQYSGSPVA